MHSRRSGLFGPILNDMGLPPWSGTLDLFSNLYAVVLHHSVGSGYRVRWSPEHGGWLRSKDWSPYSRGRWAEVPEEIHGRPDAPTEPDRAAAVALASQVCQPQTTWTCSRCGLREPRLHFIAPNLLGEPELYCVQVPSYAVVGSGGQSHVKHWGSPFGCQAVKSSIAVDDGTGSPYIGPLAAYVYGDPLPAEEVINRDWCSRCVGFAHNVRDNAAERGESPTDWASERVRIHATALGRDLARYYGDD